MSASIEGSNQLLSKNFDGFMAKAIGEIDQMKQALNLTYQSDSAEVSDEFLEDVEKLIAVGKRVRAAANFREKLDVLRSEYQPFANQMRVKYGDFLPDEVIAVLNNLEATPTATVELFEAQEMMIEALRDETDPVMSAKKLYTGLGMISTTLDKYLSYLPRELQENVWLLSKDLLEDPESDPEKYKDQEGLYDYKIATKNTAMAILWRIEHYQEKTGHTVRQLRPFGLCAGEFIVPDDFDAPLPEDVLSAFEGE